MMTMRRRTMMGAAAAPAVQYEAFVAPANFDPNSQGLNIITVFNSFSNSDKKYIVLISNTQNTTALQASTGRTYYYSENGGSYVGIASGTITWTAGSTARHIVITDTGTGTINMWFPLTATWGHYGAANNVAITNSPYGLLNYVTVNNLSKIVSVGILGPNPMKGILTIPSSCNLSNADFSSSQITKVVLPSSATSLPSYFLYSNSFLADIIGLNYVQSFGNSCISTTKLIGDLYLPNVSYIGAGAFANNNLLTGSLTLSASFTFNNWNGTGGNLFSGCTGFTVLNLPANYTSTYLWFDFSNNWTADSLNQSIINIASGTKTVTIGATNKARLLASYPNAETNANARGITIA